MNTEEKKPGTIAAIRIRGPVRVEGKINDTISMLKLSRKNSLVLLPDTPSITGMITKVQSFITFGEINEETKKLLREKKGEKKVYHLHPPRKGFGRKGIKTVYKAGGALGNRGKDINNLIQRML